MYLLAVVTVVDSVVTDANRKFWKT